MARELLERKSMEPRRTTAQMLAVLAVTLLACGAPRTKFRHTGEPPAPRALSWDGYTVKRGEARFEGTYHGTSHEENLSPEIHDTAVRVPTTTIDGYGGVALVENLELGIRGSYADYAWTRPTARETMPIPGQPPVWGVGPEMRWSIPIAREDRVTLGLGGSLMSYRVPAARWALDTGCDVDPAQSGCVDGYRLSAKDTKTFLVTNLAVYPAFHIGERGEYGHVFAGWSMHDTFKNDGFTDRVTDESGSTLETDGFAQYAGAGYGIRYEGVLASGMLYFPLQGDKEIDQHPGFFVTVGGAVRIFTPKPRRARRVRPAEP